jgi:hypothetical protein
VPSVPRRINRYDLAHLNDLLNGHRRRSTTKGNALSPTTTAGGHDGLPMRLERRDAQVGQWSRRRPVPRHDVGVIFSLRYLYIKGGPLSTPKFRPGGAAIMPPRGMVRCPC